MTDSALARLEQDLSEIARRKRENALEHYAPYEKQATFHAASATFRERALLGGNRVGKSTCGAAEMAYHLTGQYPDWWDGRRFTQPIRAWVISNTSSQTRDVCQFKLFGAPPFGTGMIPRHTIKDVRLSTGLRDAIDHTYITHASSKLSYVGFRSYDMGRLRLQGEGLDLVWCDEEAPGDIYSELIARTGANRGIIYSTLTPLLGLTDFIERFTGSDSPDRFFLQMELDEAEHIDPDERQRIIDGYQDHERDARVRGIPMLGSGKIFTTPESEIAESQFSVPGYWRRIVGLDFGATHPTAAAWLAYDEQNDIVHVYDVYATSGKTPGVHATAIRTRGAWVPCAWPADGRSGLAEYYKQLGVNMLYEHAAYSDRDTTREAGIAEMADRFSTARFRVFSHLEDWFAEYRRYHRKDGKVVKRHDDLLDATRYALMMLRYAKSKEQSDRASAPLPKRKRWRV